MIRPEDVVVRVDGEVVSDARLAFNLIALRTMVEVAGRVTLEDQSGSPIATVDIDRDAFAHGASFASAGDLPHETAVRTVHLFGMGR